MGEYATRASDGQEIKLGTCESMYYIRAEPRHAVRALPNSLNLASDDVYSVRFRFPWPDEDGTKPGDFGLDGRYERAVGVDFPASSDVEHYTVQFTAREGYVTSLPCPEGTPNPAIHRNGFAGAVQLVQQKLLRDGRLVPVLRCGGCGTMWRLEDQGEIEALAVAFRIEADRREKMGQHNLTGAVDRQWWDIVADRILLGSLILEPQP